MKTLLELFEIEFQRAVVVEDLEHPGKGAGLRSVLGGGLGWSIGEPQEGPYVGGAYIGGAKGAETYFPRPLIPLVPLAKHCRRTFSIGSWLTMSLFLASCFTSASVRWAIL